MTHSNVAINETEKSILKSLVGSKLVSINGAVVGPNILCWKVIRLHFGLFSIDIYCDEECQKSTEEITSDFVPLTIKQSSTEILNDHGADIQTTIFPINKELTSVQFRTNHVDIYDSGTLSDEITYTQAIFLNVGDEIITVNQNDFFINMMNIEFNKDAHDLVEANPDSWEDIPEELPGIHYEFRSQIETL